MIRIGWMLFVAVSVGVAVGAALRGETGVGLGSAAVAAGAMALPVVRDFLLSPAHKCHFESHRDALFVPVGESWTKRPGEVWRLADGSPARRPSRTAGATLGEKSGWDWFERCSQILIENSKDIIFVIDGKSVIQFVTASGPRLLDVQLDDLLGTELMAFIERPEDHPLTALFSATTSEPVQLQLRSADGTLRWFEMRAEDMTFEPDVAGVVVTASEISAQKKAELDLRRSEARFRALAQHTSDLIVVLNEDGLILWASPSAMNKLGYTPTAILDKEFSHLLHEGDRRGLAHRLAVLDQPTEETGIPFELNVRGADDQWHIVETRLTDLRNDPNVAGMVLTGHVLTEGNRSTPHELIRNAGTAMRSAKARGRGRVSGYEAPSSDDDSVRSELRSDLAHALRRKELTVHYQPFVDLVSGAVTGFQAVMRWRHPTRGVISPATFVPLAQESELIVPIGRWLLETALCQLKEWQQLDVHTSALTVSFEMFGRQLEDEAIVADLAAAIANANLDPSTVIVEVTERIAAQASTLTPRLEDIAALGVGLHVVAFGLGLTSHSRLQSLPFTGIKLDRSVVAALNGSHPESAQLQIRSIISIAAETGMYVIADAIESAAQLQQLKTMGCDRAQGIYFGRPTDPLTAAQPLRTAARIRTPVMAEPDR